MNPFPARRVPLAWLNLMHNKAKLLGSLAGVTFAVTLMFMEMGFQNALLDAMVQLVRKLDADLFLVNKSSYSLNFKSGFSRRHLYEVGRFEGVERVSPLYIESNLSRWRPLHARPRQMIRVVAFDPTDRVFIDPAINAQLAALQAPQTALFDSGGKWWVYHAPAEGVGVSDRFLVSEGGPAVGATGELSGRAVRVAGRFSMGADLLNDSTLLMSDRNYIRYFADPRLARPELLQVDLGLIRVAPETAADSTKLRALRDRIQETLPKSVRVCTRGDLIGEEQGFWLNNTPVGFVFWLGMAMGFVVGLVICYQILHSDISSYLREYATLLALGYTRGFLVRVVLQEAVYLALMGFACGTTITSVAFRGLEAYTRLPFVLDPYRLVCILLATLSMCVGSACLAARKLWKASPAELF